MPSRVACGLEGWRSWMRVPQFSTRQSMRGAWDQMRDPLFAQLPILSYSVSPSRVLLDTSKRESYFVVDGQNSQNHLLATTRLKPRRRGCLKNRPSDSAAKLNYVHYRYGHLRCTQYYQYNEQKAKPLLINFAVHQLVRIF
jgi:hypothetical protein